MRRIHRLFIAALAFLVAASLFPVPTRADGAAVTYRIGAGGDYATIQQALDALDGSASEVTLQLLAANSDATLSVPADRQLDKLTIEAKTYKVCTTLYANGVPTRIVGGSLSNAFGGARNSDIAGDTSLTLEGTRINGNVFGGGEATAGQHANVSGTARLSILNNGALITVMGITCGGGYAQAGGTAQCGAVDFTMRGMRINNYLGGGYAAGAGANADVSGAITHTWSGNDNNDIYFGGYAAGENASAKAGSVYADVRDCEVAVPYGGGYANGAGADASVLGAIDIHFGEGSLCNAYIYGGGYAQSGGTANASSTSVSFDASTFLVYEQLGKVVCGVIKAGGRASGADAQANVTGQAALSFTNSTTGSNIYAGGEASAQGTANVGSAKLTLVNCQSGTYDGQRYTADQIVGGGEASGGTAQVLGNVQIQVQDSVVQDIVLGGTIESAGNAQVAGDAQCVVAGASQIEGGLYGQSVVLDDSVGQGAVAGTSNVTLQTTAPVTLDTIDNLDALLLSQPLTVTGSVRAPEGKTQLGLTPGAAFAPGDVLLTYAGGDTAQDWFASDTNRLPSSSGASGTDWALGAAYYTITTSAGPHGSVTPTHSVDAGSDTQVLLTPDAGYAVDTVSIDGVSQSAVRTQYDFAAVDANHTLHATFRLGNNTITDDAHGIVVSGAIAPDAAFQLTQLPLAGAAFEALQAQLPEGSRIVALYQPAIAGDYQLPLQVRMPLEDAFGASALSLLQRGSLQALDATGGQITFTLDTLEPIALVEAEGGAPPDVVPPPEEPTPEPSQPPATPNAGNPQTGDASSRYLLLALLLAGGCLAALRFATR
nr:hypothetical protein [Maliibacterium massiliense]